LIAYVLVFLYASFAVFCLNAGFAHAQNTSQVSESAQKQNKPQISLTSAERAWLAQNHTVRVRAADYEPYLIIREGEPKGISIDYIRLISERAGINIEIIKETRSFGEAFESFKELNGPDWLPHLTPTIEREPYANWSSKSYTSSPRVIFTKKNREFLLDTDNLASKTIAGSRGNIVVKMLKDKYPHIRFTLFDNVGDAMEAVAVGEADAIVTSLTFGTYLIHKRGLSNLKVAGPSPLGNMNFRFAIRKDWPELPGIIDKALDTISAEERSAIENRYLSPVKYEYGITPAGVLKRILSVVGAASGILLLFVFWNRLLKKQVSERTSELTAVNKSLEDEIGERRRAEEKLRYQATLLENISDAVVSVDMDFKIRSWNDAAENIYGWKAEEVEGKSFREVTALEYLDEKREEVLGKVQRKGVWLGELIQSRKDGKRIVVQTTLSSIKDKEGVPLGLVGVNRDITTRKQAEEALKASQEEARLLAGKLITTQEQERSRLARELHDDITQRLALINIEVDKLELQHKSLSEPIKERLRQIGDNLGELASDIVMISRQLHPSILDDLGLIQAIESECNNFTRLREIPVTLDLDTTLHNLSKETALCIYRILQEGLRNIDQHARATDIQVQLSQENNTVYFVLRDNGVGFDLDSSSRRRGLGLASMGERARLINGDLSIESRSGKGTVIKLEIPFVD
jgi:PAS domain S-box-containing protein